MIAPWWVGADGATAAAEREPEPWSRLVAGEVHVWWASLDGRDDLPALAGLLAADERARAGRFRFPRDRERFVAGRGLLRSLLGRYLDRDPAALRFRYGPHGKPALAGAAGGTGLRFNVAHAGGLGLVAAAVDRELGVDVERVRSDLPVAAMAEVAFSPRERAALATVPAARRPAAFLARWVMKEAYVKAAGGGLSLPLDRITIELGPDADPRATVAVADSPTESERWTLCRLDVAPGHVAALAVEGSDPHLRCRRWPADIDELGAKERGEGVLRGRPELGDGSVFVAEKRTTDSATSSE